jgi:hypothetical protein
LAKVLSDDTEDEELELPLLDDELALALAVASAA